MAAQGNGGYWRTVKEYQKRGTPIYYLQWVPLLDSVEKRNGSSELQSEESSETSSDDSIKM